MVGEERGEVTMSGYTALKRKILGKAMSYGAPPLLVCVAKTRPPP